MKYCKKDDKLYKYKFYVANSYTLHTNIKNNQYKSGFTERKFAMFCVDWLNRENKQCADILLSKQ